MGVGFSDPDNILEWIAEEEFQYEIWSDTDKTLALYYGAVGSAAMPLPSRITVLLDADGVQILEYTKGVSVGTHPAEVLEDCQAIFGQ